MEKKRYKRNLEKRTISLAAFILDANPLDSCETDNQILTCSLSVTQGSLKHKRPGWHRSIGVFRTGWKVLTIEHGRVSYLKFY